MLDRNIIVRMALLDLDGTLVDSVPDLACAVDDMQRELGRAVYGEAKVRHWVGNGVERLVKRALTDDLYAEPDVEEFERALPIFMRAYHRSNGKFSRLFPGVREGIDYLKSCHIQLGCVTNKARAFTEPLLQHLGVLQEFSIVVSGDTLPVKKPDPQPLLHAAQYFDVLPQQALMIGDSQHDVEAARRAGFHVICVSYGYNHGEDIRASQPDEVVDSLAELPNYLCRH